VSTAPHNNASTCRTIMFTLRARYATIVLHVRLCGHKRSIAGRTDRQVSEYYALRGHRSYNAILLRIICRWPQYSPTFYPHPPYCRHTSISVIVLPIIRRATRRRAVATRTRKRSEIKYTEWLPGGYWIIAKICLIQPTVYTF
jgi:hypothetical protein